MGKSWNRNVDKYNKWGKQRDAKGKKKQKNNFSKKDYTEDISEERY